MVKGKELHALFNAGPVIHPVRHIDGGSFRAKQSIFELLLKLACFEGSSPSREGHPHGKGSFPRHKCGVVKLEEEEEEKEREERRQCWNGHKHVLKAHRGSKHSYT